MITRQKVLVFYAILEHRICLVNENLTWAIHVITNPVLCIWQRGI